MIASQTRIDIKSSTLHSTLSEHYFCDESETHCKQVGKFFSWTDEQ